MFLKLPDDSVHDQNGRMLYFSAQRFIDEICQGDHCFICGASPVETKFNNEHVIPDWIVRKYNLAQASGRLELPNGEQVRYGRSYGIQCCKRCNDEMSEVFEGPIARLVARGHTAVMDFVNKNGPWLLFNWLNLIFLKTHLKDRQFDFHQNRSLGLEEKIADSYEWEQLHHLHCIARAFYTGCELDPTAFGSLFILPAQPDDALGDFDFCDRYRSQTMLLRLGEVAFIAVLNDSSAVLNVVSEKLNGLPAPLSGLQMREFMAHCALVNINLEERPDFVSQFKPKEGRYVISAQRPAQIRLRDYVPSELGEILYGLLADFFESVPVEERAGMEEAVKQGRFSFFKQSSGL